MHRCSYFICKGHTTNCFWWWWWHFEFHIVLSQRSTKLDHIQSPVQIQPMSSVDPDRSGSVLTLNPARVLLPNAPKEKMSSCFHTVILQIWHHDEMGQSTNFSLLKIVTYLIFYLKFTCYLSGAHPFLELKILPIPALSRLDSSRVKVKNELIKRHKTTHNVQIQRRWLRYS